jgi:hypothetical protein
MVAATGKMTQAMDDEQRRKHAPWRNKHYSHLRSFEEEADWADTLDWKTNDYAFYRLFESVFASLDSDYRQSYGVRVDQLADRDELYAVARDAASFYQEHEQDYHIIGIYLHLHHRLRECLWSRIEQAHERRRGIAEYLDDEQVG